ncbi:nucleoside phosphorylase-I family protein [Pseudomonas viridiflava]
MQISDTAVIYEAESLAEANQKITEGWRLLTVLATTRPNGQTLPFYILGRIAKAPSQLPESGGFQQVVGDPPRY